MTVFLIEGQLHQDAHSRTDLMVDWRRHWEDTHTHLQQQLSHKTHTCSLSVRYAVMQCPVSLVSVTSSLTGVVLLVDAPLMVLLPGPTVLTVMTYLLQQVEHSDLSPTSFIVGLTVHDVVQCRRRSCTGVFTATRVTCNHSEKQENSRSGDTSLETDHRPLIRQDYQATGSLCRCHAAAV